MTPFGSSLAAGIYTYTPVGLNLYACIRTTPASVLRLYVLSIDRGEKHRGIFATKADTYGGTLPNYIR